MGVALRTIVSDSGNHLWQHVFRKAPDDLTLSTEAGQELDHVLRFSANFLLPTSSLSPCPTAAVR
jgi:hypothetical protein